MGVIKNFKLGNKGRVTFTSIDDDAIIDSLGQQTHIANITTTATSGSLPTANGTVTIANTATPTVVELLEYCVELETKVEAILTALRNQGLLASS